MDLWRLRKAAKVRITLVSLEEYSEDCDREHRDHARIIIASLRALSRTLDLWAAEQVAEAEANDGK